MRIDQLHDGVRVRGEALYEDRVSYEDRTRARRHKRTGLGLGLDFGPGSVTSGVGVDVRGSIRNRVSLRDKDGTRIGGRARAVGEA